MKYSTVTLPVAGITLAVNRIYGMIHDHIVNTG